MRKFPTKAEFDNLFDPEEELFGGAFEWPLAPDYTTWQGKIYPSPGRPPGRFPPQNPFARTDLFYSFARLGANGEPSESRIKEWVSQNGLLTRKEERLSGATVLNDDTVNQQPISVEDFRSEVSRARGMLELYGEIRRSDTRAIDLRIAQPRSALDQQLASYFSRGSDRSSRWRRHIEFMEAATGLATNLSLGIADRVLAEMVSESVAHVRPRAIRGFHPPILRFVTAEDMVAARDNYRLQQAWHYPDLRSAMYMQFYLLVTRNRPVRLCENPRCRLPFPATKRNRRFCCDSCRSNARRYR